LNALISPRIEIRGYNLTRGYASAAGFTLSKDFSLEKKFSVVELPLLTIGTDLINLGAEP